MSNQHNPQSGPGGRRIAVLMTCFNRKAKTLGAIESVYASAAQAQVTLDIYLVDDSSTDGTPAAVFSRFPQVRVIAGAGDLFWCRGMHRAHAEAERGDHDYLFWLNDDTALFPDAIGRLLECERRLSSEHSGPLIIVGSTVDPASGRLTYGGEVRVSSLKPLRFVRAQPESEPVLCDSMNGNIVLVSREAARRVGNLDAAFEHAMGDTDYALRARRAGVQVWAAPGRHGVCSHNPVHGTFVDARANLATRWRHVTGRKGLPWRSWLVLTSRHGGALWPLLFIWPYVSVIIGRYGKVRHA